MILAMKNAQLAGTHSLLTVPPTLDVTRIGDHQVVHLGATPIASFPASDVSTRRHVMVQLAEAGALKSLEIAAAFEVTPVYVSLLRGRYRQEGSSGLQAGRRGPHGPMKLTPLMERRILELHKKGLSHRAIAQRMTDSGKKISRDTVRRILLNERPEQGVLPAVREPEPEEPITVLVAAAGENEKELPQGSTRYAGAMLLYVALEQLGLWSVFESLGARLDRSRMAAAQLIGIIALGFALRFKSIERFKTAVRRDFGMLLGLQGIPSVQTLRTNVGDLVDSVDPDEVMRKLLAAFVELEPVWEGAYYIDGHFCPYSGMHPLPKGWNARRRLAEPGQTDAYVHDATGRALFFINRPLNDHLSKVLPAILQEIRGVAKDQQILLIFDRGGYSGPLFQKLTDEGVHFITYLKGRKARRRFPSDRFERRWWEAPDPAGIKKTKRYVYDIYEKGTRVRGAGILRTLVLKDEDGQIPVLTNCPEMASAKVVHMLKMRWRQENSFKYLSENYSVEQLVQYGADYHQDERMVDNPKRVVLRRKIEQVQMDIVFKESELGQALEYNDEKVHRTARGLKHAHSTLRREIDQLYERVHRLENRLVQTPAKVALKAIKDKPLQAIQRTDRRNMVNAIKLATYNAERLLARKFFRHYQDPRDWLTICRSFFHLSGTISYTGDQLMVVELRAPDRPHIRRALEATIEDLNTIDSKLFGRGPKLTFAVKS
jgi:transposase